MTAEEFAAMLAKALHDADCGCADFGDPVTDEDDRYITAARAALATVPAEVLAAALTPTEWAAGQLPPATFDDYRSTVAAARVVHPDWRHGQAAFNVLAGFRPHLAEPIRGDVAVDPFYRDENLGLFYAYVCDNWEAES